MSEDPREPTAGGGVRGQAAAPAQRTPVGDAAAALRRRWGLILVAIALGALAGVLLRSASTPSYAATAKLLVDQQHPVDALLGTAAPPTDPTRDLSTTVRLVALEPVAARVRRDLRLGGSTQDLLSHVSAKLDGNTNIVDITATDADPRQATRIANQFALGYRRVRAESAGASLDAAARAGQDRLNRLGPDAPGTPVGRELAGEIRRLQILGALQTGGVQIVRPATAPTSASGLGTGGAAITGGLLAGLIALGAVLLLSRVDRRINDGDDVERALDLPVLAVVPRRRRRASSAGDDDRADAYATLAYVAFTKADNRSNVLLVASPDQSEGAPEVVLELARAMSGRGRWVLAIDADLRSPHLAQLADVDPGAGLAGLLASDAGPDQLPEQVVELAPDGEQRPISEGEAWLLPAGPSRSSSQALLGGPKMAAIVDEARAQADAVVIAGGALTEPGSHALSLAPIVDTAVLVVRRGRTREAAARRAVRSMQALEVAVLGVVLTDAERGRRAGVRR
ncbi:MAG: hypothetical protein JWQ20_1506, partial [Conexibacter sp.]|nr:hypothetical protein [Conexibacter sp.]